MGLGGKRAIVLVDNAYQEMEVWYRCTVCGKRGRGGSRGAGRGQTYPSKLGYPATSDKAAADVSMADYDALVIPGGYAPDYCAAIRRSSRSPPTRWPRTRSWGRSATRVGCCARRRRAQGRKVTSFFAIKDDMTNAGANGSTPKSCGIGTDHQRKPDDLPAFMKGMLSALAE